MVLCERTCCWIKLLELRNLPNGFAFLVLLVFLVLLSPLFFLLCARGVVRARMLLNYVVSIVEIPPRSRCCSPPINCPLSSVLLSAVFRRATSHFSRFIVPNVIRVIVPCLLPTVVHEFCEFVRAKRDKNCQLPIAPPPIQKNSPNSHGTG